MCVCCLEQVVPQAVAAGSKQQHAATVEIAAVAVSNREESALVVAPQYTGAVRGRAYTQVRSHCTHQKLCPCCRVLTLSIKAHGWLCA